MQFTDFGRLDTARLPSPCFVVDEVAVERNLAILQQVGLQADARVLHALKAFAMFSLAPLSARYLWGTCASGLHEALLGKEFYGGEVHVFSAGYNEADLRELLQFADHVVFNSCSQLARFESQCREALRHRPTLRFGLRVNPRHSEGTVPLYDPCAPGSRLGVTLQQLERYLAEPRFAGAWELVSGLHFHTLCEQGFEPLERTLDAVTRQFGHLFPTMEWINFGGGHHISHPEYEVERLVECIRAFSAAHGLKVYLEPGEAVAIGTGVLVCEVLDVIYNDMPQLILDTSATCHMPDTLEMPYRADILGAGMPNEKAHTYRLGGLTCLAGDVIGDYSFDEPVQVGDRLVFEDMSHYTMVKTTTFNGTALPSIAIWNSESDDLRLVKQFGYEDFRERLS
jgi:carboxynorspermidine decarboxylase